MLSPTKSAALATSHGLTSGFIEYRPELWLEDEQMAPSG